MIDLHDPRFLNSIGKYFFYPDITGKEIEEVRQKVNFPYDYHILGTTPIVSDTFKVIYICKTYAYSDSLRGCQ